MVNKCSAYGYTSGYKSHKTDESISFHSFPVNNKDIWTNGSERTLAKTSLLRNILGCVRCILNPVISFNNQLTRTQPDDEISALVNLAIVSFDDFWRPMQYLPSFQALPNIYQRRVPIHDRLSWAAPDFFSGGAKGQGMWGQILAMEGLLMDAWAITGEQLGGKAKARGQLSPCPPPLEPPMPTVNVTSGLTRETFLALCQTCMSLRDCAIHLLTKCGFNYVLLGQLQSDGIESRFGWFRQLSGAAHYYVSMQQVLESDWKIRALSLTKFSSYSLAEIYEAIETAELVSAANESLDSSTADAISDKLT